MITLKEQLCRCEHLKGEHTFCGCGVDLCECGQFAIKDDKQTVVIRNEEGDYWSNEDGWTALSQATQFSEGDTTMLRLPIAGAWISLSEAKSLSNASI